MILGDMTVIGTPPAKLLKACAAIADQLHPTFELHPRIAHRDKSKESCVMCSLAVRDFLLRIGFADARVRPVAVVIAALEGDVILHSLGIGTPDTPPRDKYWVGHMVVETSGWLIDTTLYPAIRPQWRGNVTGMLVLAAETPPGAEPMFGLDCLTGVERCDGSYEFGITYLDNPANTAWKSGPDALDPKRRKPAVRAVRDRFGTWKDQ